MIMARALPKSPRVRGLNDNVTLAILGATMRTQDKWPPRPLQGLGASDPQQDDGGGGVVVKNELVHMAHDC